MFRSALSALALSLVVTPALAAQVLPTSYDMQNGETGSYQYWDESYSGAGNPSVSLSPLSGGTGDLTDGVIATDNWSVVEAPAGPGPYVGWFRIDPIITFDFAAVTSFTSMTFHFDDSNGSGGVAPPASVSVNGGAYGGPVIDDANPAPFAHVVDLTGLTTDTITAQIFRQPGRWIFLSEVTFDADIGGAQVPLPAGVLLLGTALAGLGIARRRST
jgi:hypothetical protein